MIIIQVVVKGSGAEEQRIAGLIQDLAWRNEDRETSVEVNILKPQGSM